MDVDEESDDSVPKKKVKLSKEEKKALKKEKKKELKEKEKAEGGEVSPRVVHCNTSDMCDAD